MNPFQCKDVSGGKVGHKCKCKPRCSQIIVKEEVVVVKEEPNYMIQYSPPPIGTGATIKSESESDDECMQNDVKDEIKCEDECAKKECDTAHDDGEGGIGDNGPVDANAENPSRNDMPNTSNGNRKKPKGAKKVRKGKTSKKSKVTPQLKKHKCHVCHYSARDKTALTIHIRVHTDERPFACEICAKAFNKKYNLIRHKKVHAAQLPFRCSKCRIGFKEEIDKINHETKCKRPQYQCHLCKNKIQDLSHLKKHIRIHSGVKPFKCHVCFKTLTQKSSFNVHLRTHVEQLPFDCRKCGQRFGDENQKKSHEDRCNRRRYNCYLCQYKCFIKGHLQQHMRSKHTDEKPFSCGICQKAYRRKHGLKRHLTTHNRKQPIRCSKCWNKFAEEADKKAHEDRCKRRTNQCYLCKIVKQDSQKLKGHTRTHHTGVKPFSCKLCGMCFTWRSAAKRHMKNIHRVTK